MDGVCLNVTSEEANGLVVRVPAVVRGEAANDEAVDVRGLRLKPIVKPVSATSQGC